MDECSQRPPACGVARRRRERRLRSMLRHELQTVRMALATALHHSSGKVHATRAGRRWRTRRTTANGHRSLHLLRSGPVVSLTRGRSGVTAPCGTPRGDAPLLVVPALHGEDSVDGTTVSFLLRQTLVLKKKGGGEGEEAEAVDAGAPLAVGDASRWPLAPADEEDDGTPQAPRCKEEEEEEEEEEDSQNLFLSWPRSSSTAAVVCPWLVTLVQCLRSVLFVCRQAYAASMDGTDQKDSTHRALVVDSGSDQKDSYAVGWFCWYSTSHCVPFRCRQAHDACHHGRYGPEGALRGAVQKTADSPQLQFIEGRRFPCRCAEADSPRLFVGPKRFPSCLDTVINVPVAQVVQIVVFVVAQKRFPMVQTVRRTKEIPQLLGHGDRRPCAFCAQVPCW